MSPARDKILVLFLAIAAGSGGSALHNRILPPAPDRYTGTQAAAAAAKQADINAAMNSRVMLLEARSERLEKLLEKIDDGVHRIELALHDLPPPEWQRRIRALERALPRAQAAPHP